MGSTYTTTDHENFTIRQDTLRFYEPYRQVHEHGDFLLCIFSGYPKISSFLLNQQSQQKCLLRAAEQKSEEMLQPAIYCTGLG
jgi:hypothetical protein